MSIVRRGRGRSDKTLQLLVAAREILLEEKPCGVRAVAYKLFSRKLITDMSKESAGSVSRLLKDAREKEEIPWEWIVDDTRQLQTIPTYADPAEYARRMQQGYIKNKWLKQPKYIVLVVEKGTVAGTLQPVLDEFEVDFLIMHGFASASAVYEIVRANLEREQHTLVLYCGDFDPSGMSMSERDLPERLARYSTDTPSVKIADPRTVATILASVRLEIRRIALTRQDSRLLGRGPAFPASDKQKDARYPWFVEHFGRWCWELDALPPSVLRLRVRDAIVAAIEPDAWNRSVNAEQVERQSIFDLCETITNLPTVPDDE
jgi:hypothetical protein